MFRDTQERMLAPMCLCTDTQLSREKAETEGPPRHVQEKSPSLAKSIFVNCNINDSPTALCHKMQCMTCKLELASIILVSMAWDSYYGNLHQRARVTDVLPRQAGAQVG